MASAVPVLFPLPAFVSMLDYGSAAEVQGKPIADLPIVLEPAQPIPVGSRTNGRQPTNGSGRNKSSDIDLARNFECQSTSFQFKGRDLRLVTLQRGHSRDPIRTKPENESQFRAIFEAAAIDICRCTMDGRVVETNPAFQRMLGYSYDELCGMHFRDFSHPDDDELRLQLFEEMVAGRRDSYRLEVRYPRRNGQSDRWARLTVFLVRNAQGEPECSIGMMEDITGVSMPKAKRRGWKHRTTRWRGRS